MQGSSSGIEDVRQPPVPEGRQIILGAGEGRQHEWLHTDRGRHIMYPERV